MGKPRPCCPWHNHRRNRRDCDSGRESNSHYVGKDAHRLNLGILCGRSENNLYRCSSRCRGTAFLRFFFVASFNQKPVHDPVLSPNYFSDVGYAVCVKHLSCSAEDCGPAHWFPPDIAGLNRHVGVFQNALYLPRIRIGRERVAIFVRHDPHCRRDGGPILSIGNECDVLRGVKICRHDGKYAVTEV